MAYFTTSRSTYSSDSGGSPSGSPGRSSTSRYYMCKVCGNQFTSGQSLGGHMNVHRKDSKRSSPKSSTSPQEFTSPGVESCHQSYKGVRFRKEQCKWVAEIRPPRSTKTWWLGTYSTPEEAAYAYDVAITYFGSESSLNFDGHPIYEQIPRISPELQKQDFASELRKVVKKYGKMAMESGTTATTAAASASTSTASEAREVFGWDDFTAPPEIYSNSGWADNLPFDFEQPTSMQAPESSYQLPDYDQGNCYYGQAYQQDYNWPSYHGYDGHYYP